MQEAEGRLAQQLLLQTRLLDEAREGIDGP
jgi:hypothetical protein